MSSRCRAAALGFLKIRPRSVKELEAKLKDKEFSSGEIAEVLEYLTQLRLLDDRAFTVGWIRYRLARPFGFQRIVRELKEKGIAEGIITEVIAQFKEENPEEVTAQALAKHKAERLAAIDPVKRKKRVLDFLLRRGFSMDVVYKAIKKV